MGVGKVNSTECMLDLLRHYGGSSIKEVIWSGIAGITPQIGGMLDSAGKLRTASEKTVIGDVCISYLARDWDLQYSSRYDGTWWIGKSANKSRTSVGDVKLAEELWKAAQQVTWPDIPEGPASNIKLYHGEPGLRKAKAFNWLACGEVTGDNFWHGVDEDARARQLVAEFITEVTGKQVTASDVFAVTAMEQTGWMNALEDWNKAKNSDIPFAYSRSSSNFDHTWLDSKGNPLVKAAESIESGMSKGGSVYGSVTAALPVLKMLELRSKSK
jgi:purine nucleoside permease